MDTFLLETLFKAAFDQAERGWKMDCQISMLLYYDPETDSKIIQFFGIDYDTKFFREEINRMCKEGLMRDYHYQNQTGDGEDDDYWNDYEEREKIWDRILGREGIPSCVGFCYEFFRKTNLWNFARKMKPGNFK
jgi:hypothetical protein